MLLFSKEKELIFRITNAVFLLWFVGAVIFTFIGIVNLWIQEPALTYDEYAVTNCRWYNDMEELAEEELEDRCKKEYESRKVWRKSDDYRKKMAIYTSGINLVVVGGVLYFMNFAKKAKR